MDRPIIFSASMVRALLEGRKCQTRRLASSPLRKCQPGDRLYVRENWRADDFAPNDASRTIFMADAPTQALRETRGIIKWRPCIHMPRARSRLTLIVAATRVERLKNISPQDARDEGVSSVREFEDLWTSLHGTESWEANPQVVALTFCVARANIDTAGVRAA